MNHEPFQLIGASRTDTGVHASGQVLKLSIPKDIDPKNLVLGMNTKLPSDIRVISATRASKEFNVNADVKSKEYHYYFSQGDQIPAAVNQIVYYIPEHLDIEAMKLCCKYLEGKNDFFNFCPPSIEEQNTIREITHARIDEANFHPIANNIFYLSIKASGFLKYMVRYIMGALLEVGQKKITINDFQEKLSLKLDHQFKCKAPAHGLHLIEITY